MSGATFVIVSGVMIESLLRGKVSAAGLALAALFAVLSMMVSDWTPIALAASALLVLIAVTSIQRADDVIRAVFVAMLSADLAMQSPGLSERMAYLVHWDEQLARATITAVAVGLSFTVAGIARRDGRLIPYGAVGAAALPAVSLPAAVIWATTGVVFLVLRELRGSGALVLVIIAVTGVFASLLL